MRGWDVAADQSTEGLPCHAVEVLLYFIIETEPLIVTKQGNDVRLLQTSDTQTMKLSVAVNSTIHLQHMQTDSLLFVATFRSSEF